MALSFPAPQHKFDLGFVKDEVVFCYFSSSATAEEGRCHRGDAGLKENNIQAVCSCSQLDSQQALCLLESLK